MSAPLTPSDCDLQDFPFMPLHVARLRDSDLASEEAPEACWYAVLLWAASWHQIPAASLPDNDAVLTKLIGLGRDVKTFRRHRVAALRGFVKCDDGRLYHPVVAEQALTAWEGKLQQRWRTECGRIKKHNQRTGENLTQPTYEEFLSRVRPGAVPAPVPGDMAAGPSGQRLQEKEKGTETGTDIGSVSDETGGDAPSDDGLDPLADLRALPVAKGSWRLAVKVLVEQGRLTDPKARALVGKLKAQGLTDDELWQISEAAFNEQTEAPQPYLIRAAEGVIARRGSFDPMLQPEEWRQRKWMEEHQEGQFAWDPRRGPRPGEPGCRVSPAIQREFGVEPAAPQPVRGVA